MIGRGVYLHSALLILQCLILPVAMAGGSAPDGSGAATGVTAIDVLLVPDAAMMEAARAANARLRAAHPGGFALDATHVPHVTLLQRYVRTADLDKVYGAVRRAMAGESPAAWKLKATGVHFTPWTGGDLASIVVEPTDDLLRLQRKLIGAVAPFTGKHGAVAAFFTTPAEPEIDPAIVAYVGTFVPEGTGGNYFPHVTVGLASPEGKRAMLEAKFEPFTFSAAGVAVYQLGHYGTARKKLQGVE
jgi:hypothetical protein